MPIPRGYRRLEGSEHKVKRGARLVGPANPKEKISVTVRVRRRADAPPLAGHEYWMANPPGRRQFLSRLEFADRFGAAPADFDQVTKFARSHRLSVGEAHVARRSIAVSGTVRQMEQAFGVTLGQYRSQSESYRGLKGHIHVPQELAGIVVGVFGLDDRRVVERNAGPAGTSVLTPTQVAGLYKFPISKAAGQTIGILEFGGGIVQDGSGKPTDLDQFCSSLGIATPKVTVVPVGAGASNPGDASTVDSTDKTFKADIETALDVEVTAAIGQGADIAVYFAKGGDWMNAILAAIHPDPGQPVPSVLSISWGGTETHWSAMAIANTGDTFQEAAALGITVLVATGDDGSDQHEGDGLAHVQYPASDPFVTSCGGTTIENVSGSSFDEGTWNDGGAQDGATGGGVSTLFPVPPWQMGAGVPPSANPGGAAGRGIPDISGNASPYSGYDLVLYGQSTASLIQTGGGGKGDPCGSEGGTSAVAPLYAGLVALINAELGVPVGFLNPTLYALAGAGAGVFRDINDGVNNSWPQQKIATTPSYTAGPGWDACTGLGSIDGTALLTALVGKMINPDDPFNLGNWLNHDEDGGDDTGDDIELGNSNNADPNDATIIRVHAAGNAALAGLNEDDTDGGVGVFGRSQTKTRSIGVGGESETGCGVYGIATAGDTIGVAGRAMSGTVVEDTPLEQLAGAPVGVLGHAMRGFGVRGHAGPLAPIPPGKTAPPLPDCGPGAVFSAGQLQDQKIGTDSKEERVSVDSVAQLRILPSVARTLPTRGQIGDLFLVRVVGRSRWAPIEISEVRLFLCTQVISDVAQWQPVQLDAAVAGGTPLAVP